MSNFEDRLKEVQSTLSDDGIEGWLLYDYRHSNSLAHAFLEIPKESKVTRRFFYWIPQKGESIKIVPLIEPYTLDHLPGIKWFYRGWQELERLLFSLVTENGKIAMEYSPYSALPNVSKVDGGMVDLIRKAGANIVSSADLLQKYTSGWTKEQLQSHLAAAHALEQIVDRTWSFIALSMSNQIALDEYQVQQFMLKEMETEGCWTSDWPTCAVNHHSADPHYLPLSATAQPIREGDLVLIDLWCKQKNAPRSVYADITRVGVVGSHPTPKQEEIFKIVKHARDAATQFIKEHYEQGRPIEGWQVDQICRDIINEAGYGEYFIHRTGHNIGEEVHGSGANLDNLETHDYRRLLPGTGFSVEPGIYLPQQFGIRLEYDIYLEPQGKVCITGGIQEEIFIIKPLA